MKILETEIDFNFNDADDMEKLENAIDITQDSLNNIQNEGKRTSEIIRETCNIIFNCFNTAFGEGTDKEVFGDKTSLDICMKAFHDLIDAKIDQEKALEKEMKSLETQYSPNRATRRSKK